MANCNWLKFSYLNWELVSKRIVQIRVVRTAEPFFFGLLFHLVNMKSPFLVDNILFLSDRLSF